MCHFRFANLQVRLLTFRMQINCIWFQCPSAFCQNVYSSKHSSSSKETVNLPQLNFTAREFKGYEDQAKPFVSTPMSDAWERTLFAPFLYFEYSISYPIHVEVVIGKDSMNIWNVSPSKFQHPKYAIDCCLLIFSFCGIWKKCKSWSRYVAVTLKIPH